MGKNKKKNQQKQENIQTFSKESTTELRQWAQRVIGFSSQSATSPSQSASSLLGKKDIKEDEEREHKLGTGWTPKEATGTLEFIEVSFHKDAKVSEIRILERYFNF